MDHKNNGLHQLLKKDHTTKIKAKTLRVQFRALKDKKLIANKSYYYLNPTDLPAPRFYGPPKTHKPGVPICPIVSHSGSHSGHQGMNHPLLFGQPPPFKIRNCSSPHFCSNPPLYEESFG